MVVQVKRIHEYKRQLLNILQIIHRYNELKRMRPEDRAKMQAKTCFVGGKAAAGARSEGVKARAGWEWSLFLFFSFLRVLMGQSYTCV